MPNTTPKHANLFRFRPNFEAILREYPIWRLNFPIQDAVFEYANAIEAELERWQIEKPEFIGIPYRVLNNAMMTLISTLSHGFEKYENERFALLLEDRNLEHEQSMLPKPKSILRILRRWIIDHWAKRPHVLKLPEEVRNELLDALLATLEPFEEENSAWGWKQIDPQSLIDKKVDTLNFKLIPAILASLLHGKESIIAGRKIKWRKVQEENGKVSLIGFAANGGPLLASYDLTKIFEARKAKRKIGEGYFAYKVDFSLQTQAGRGEPWLFISIHAQRYGNEKLSKENAGRNLSFLVGANRARMDEFHWDTTLIKLKASKNDEGWEWEDELTILLDKIGLLKERRLQAPHTLVEHTEPSKFWKPDAAGNDYYLIYDTGYKYGVDSKDHEIMPGFSMSHSREVLSAILAHLPMLEQDDSLIADEQNAKRIAWAMKTHSDLEDSKAKEKFPVNVEHILKRALNGESLNLTIVYFNDTHYEALCFALAEFFSFGEGLPIPENLKIHAIKVPLELYYSFIGKNEHQAKAREWKDFLEEMIPPEKYNSVIVELFAYDADKQEFLDKDNEWHSNARGRMRGAIRQAASQLGITSQMIRTLRLKKNEETKKNSFIKDGEHRARNAIGEVFYRQNGALLDDVTAIHKFAGFTENVDVIAFYLRQTQGNIFFPIAVKLDASGVAWASFPDENNEILPWMPYPEAQTRLGQLFASQWKHTIYNSKRKVWELRPKYSALELNRVQANHFVAAILTRLSNATIAVIEANNWRNYNTWPQLRNSDLFESQNTLDFSTKLKNQISSEPIYPRSFGGLQNLLGIVRLRTGVETPQYFTDTDRAFSQLAGFIDTSAEMFTYFSIGKFLQTNKPQDVSETRSASMFDGIGAGIKYGFPQVVELVPFFVRPDYQNEAALKKLCRIIHYLRFSPAWEHGNTIYPYPIHLAHTMMKDVLPILEMGD